MNRSLTATLSRRRFLALLGASMAVGACARPSVAGLPTAQPTGQASAEGASLTVAVETEPQTLVPTIGAARSDAAQHLFDMVHQSLVSYDHLANPVPRVAVALPSLDQGTWRVHADGTMETVWHLRPNVRWHDGEPLTAGDLIFSWRVFNDPTLPISSRRVARLIDSMESPDPRTVVMHWRSRYAFADQITSADLTILPRHLLEASFDLRREQMAGHPYWRAQFVGLGPFRVEEWGGGTIRLAGVRDYFLGAPRLDSIAVRVMADTNTAMAAVLSGSIDLLLPRRAVHGVVQTIRQRWSETDEGTLTLMPGYSWLFISPQFNGAQIEDLADRRVRQALVLALDRGAIAEAVAGDRSLTSDSWMPATDPRYASLTSGMTRYAYDPARARELFREAGWRRASADDVLVKQGRRFELEITTTQEWERASAAVVELWRDAGVSARTTVLSRSAAVDRQTRASYTGVELTSWPPSMALIDGRLNSAYMPTAETQWLGGNRGHYLNPQLDDLLDRFWTTLDPRQREQTERDITQLLASELPIFGLCFYPAMTAARRTLQGLRLPVAVGPTGQASATWNAHEWRIA